MTRNFSRQHLRGRSFVGQDLTGADFSGAQIQGANFTRADLTGANFEGAIAGTRIGAIAVILILLCLTSAVTGLLGLGFADTVNTEYFEYLGPRDAIHAFFLFLTFGIVLFRWHLLAAVVVTLFCAIFSWASVLGWAYLQHYDLLEVLLGHDTDAIAVLETSVIFWAGLSALPGFCGVLAASAHFQSARRPLIGRYELLTLAVMMTVAMPGAFGLPGAFSQANALIDTGILWFMSVHVTRQILAENSHYSGLRSVALAFAAWRGTRFYKAQLSQSRFAGARLNAISLVRADLTGTCFYEARYLDFARAGTTLLHQPNVRQLLVTQRGIGQDYTGCNLRGAYLVGADLTQADFSKADFSQVNATNADFSGANFSQSQVVGTRFYGAQLTGCCVEAWNIDSTTQLEGVACDYVYLLSGQRERRPSYGDFQPGDFTKLFQDVLHTVDLIFHQGLDMSAFMSAFKQVQAAGELRGEPISVRSIENKGDGVVVVKVEVSERANKPQIQASLNQEYDQALQRLEARYQAELAAKDEQIELYRQHRSELSQLTQLLTQSRGAQSAAIQSAQQRPAKRGVLRLGAPGPSGIPVTLQVGSEGALPQLEVSGQLPPVDELLQLQRRWRQIYLQSAQQMMSRIDFPAVQLTNVSYTESLAACHQIGQALAVRINRWFDSEAFQPIRESLMMALSADESIQLILQSDNAQIRSLPLHVWSWFERYSRAELVLSELTYSSRVPSVMPPASTEPTDPTVEDSKVKVLAILGDGNGLDLAVDRTLLERLPDVDLTCLVEPVRSQLNDSLWSQPWDILFFAGHSTRENTQQKIRINPAEGLTLSELKYALRKATERGLKLAIFNACDGLHLLQDLQKLSLPPTIVMRYPVPDFVAQTFLKYFLSALSQGLPLHLAVRDAREQLQGIESQFPFATWLPVLHQNLALPPLTWQTLKEN
ncbi:MAG: pentapeptide repeat-containing protein [Phormidesmis sp.]|mgnify:CR=1 FL=1